MMAELMKEQIKQLDNKSAEECLGLAEKLEDDKDRFACYHRAAELGNPQGQYKTGFYYWNGFGVEADRTKSIEWYIKAARQKHREALYVLSRAINYSELQDDAVESLVKSEYLRAQIVLADRHYDGGNYTESFYWFEKAAQHQNVTRILESPEEFEQFGSVADLEKRLKMFEDLAELGNGEKAEKYPKSTILACDWLANYYETQKQDEKKAEFYRNQAEEIRKSTLVE